MSNKTISIKKSELEILLSNEETTGQTLEKYFEYYEDKPFSGGYRLRPEVALIESQSQSESEGFTAKGLISDGFYKANKDARKKRDKKYDEVKNDSNRIRIVSEGDSWFQYPKFKLLGVRLFKGVKDIIDHLTEDDRYAIKSLGAGGDILRAMYHKREYIQTIREEKADLFLLSAGGNDFFEMFSYMLQKNEGSEIKDWLGKNFLIEIEALTVYYRSLLQELIEEFPKLHILIHGYDYIIPDAEKGKWIGKPMLGIGLRNKVDRDALIRFIMDSFNATIARIAADHKLQNRVHYLDIRGTVPQSPSVWHDEIHPNDVGYGLIAEKFKQKIEEICTEHLIV